MLHIFVTWWLFAWFIYHNICMAWLIGIFHAYNFRVIRNCICVGTVALKIGLIGWLIWFEHNTLSVNSIWMSWWWNHFSSKKRYMKCFALNQQIHGCWRHCHNTGLLGCPHWNAVSVISTKLLLLTAQKAKKWQLRVQSAKKIPSEWWHFRFSAWQTSLLRSQTETQDEE